MDDKLVEFALKKAENQEEYEKITELQNYILDLPDADNNEYVSQLWGILQEVVEDYEELLEAEDEEDEKDEGATETEDPSSSEAGDETPVDPSKIAFRGKRIVTPPSTQS